MAVSVLSNPVNYQMRTKLGAHQFMLALHDHLTKVGLARTLTGDDYDVDGDETQLSDAAFGDVSNWLAYNFTDGAQSMYPITVWFRLVWAVPTTSASAPNAPYFCPQYRISEGVSSGLPLGANFEMFSSGPPNYSGALTTNFTGSLGDYVRYDGNSLTVLMAPYGIVSSYNNYRGALIDLHIERRYRPSDGAVGRGVIAWAQPGSPHLDAPPQYAAAFGAMWAATTNPLQRAMLTLSTAEGNNLFIRDPHTRCDEAILNNSGGSATVAPIVALDHEGSPTVFGKFFTAPANAFTNLRTTQLDFTGELKTYLAYRPATCTVGASNFTFLIEWEG